MMTKSSRVGAAALAGLISLCQPAFAEDGGSVAKVTRAPVRGEGMAALKRAAESGKYLFVFFHNSDDGQTRAMRRVFDTTVDEIADRAEGVAIRTTDSTERAIVSKFDAKRAPMPMVLAVAPNGAVTGGFPLKFDRSLLLGAFVSRSTEQCMKALQDGKLVLLCAGNENARFSKEAVLAVRAVKADTRCAQSTEVVIVDPADKAEAAAMARLKIDAGTDEAVTLLMAPPGTIANRMQGMTDKEALVKAVQKALASSGKPCCPPGGKCGPKKKAVAKTGATPRKP